MSELVATENMLIKFTNTAGPPDLVYTGDPTTDPVKVVPVKSTKVKAESAAVCTTSVTITWTAATGGCPFTSATHTFVSGSAAIAATAQKTKAESAFVLRKGDASLVGCIGSWTPPATPPPSVPCACDCEIFDAGQTKVKAE